MDLNPHLVVGLLLAIITDEHIRTSLNWHTNANVDRLTIIVLDTVYASAVHKHERRACQCLQLGMLRLMLNAQVRHTTRR